MKLYAQVVGGVIVSTWSDSAPDPLAAGFVDTTGWAGPIVPGATVSGTVCTAAADAVPDTVTAPQAKLALLATPSPATAGKTCYDDALAAVTTAGAAAQILFNDATTWGRQDAWVLQIATSLNWSSSFVDALFVKAAAISI